MDYATGWIEREAQEEGRKEGKA